MEFVEAPAFTRFVKNYLRDDDYAALQKRLEQEPEAGDVIPGTGGLRKLRWRDRNRGKGTRGGLRIIYYYFLPDFQIWLMTIYDKDEAVDLTPREKKLLRQAIEAEMEIRQKKRDERRVKSERLGR
ncbi:MAG: transcriptional regulator [Candidatus Korobacteraceae bacterium]|jgi:hypothetical protein